MVAFHDALVTVTAEPVWLHVPFQPLDTPSPGSGQLKVRVQPLTAVAARFVTVIVAPKPPGQELLTA
jgi:hypothetical protein